MKKIHSLSNKDIYYSSVVSEILCVDPHGNSDIVRVLLLTQLSKCVKRVVGSAIPTNMFMFKSSGR